MYRRRWSTKCCTEGAYSMASFKDKLIDEWLRKARHDIASAERLMQQRCITASRLQKRP